MTRDTPRAPCLRPARGRRTRDCCRRAAPAREQQARLQVQPLDRRARHDRVARLRNVVVLGADEKTGAVRLDPEDAGDRGELAGRDIDRRAAPSAGSSGASRRPRLRPRRRERRRRRPNGCRHAAATASLREMLRCRALEPGRCCRRETAAAARHPHRVRGVSAGAAYAACDFLASFELKNRMSFFTFGSRKPTITGGELTLKRPAEALTIVARGAGVSIS